MGFWIIDWKALISQSYVTATRQATNQAAASESRVSHHTYRINNASTQIIQRSNDSNLSSVETISDLGLMTRHKAEHKRVQNSKHYTQAGFHMNVVSSIVIDPERH